MVKEMIMKEITYTHDFYGLMKGKENTCRRAVKYIVDLLSPTSVVDIGCGTGEWLALFKEFGVSEVHGYDGGYVDKNMLSILESEFTSHNLEKKISVNRRYDLAMSLEVAEHLNEKYADSFICNLTEFSDVVLFSAAIPGQGGDGHINEHWQSYWQTKFDANGFTCCDCIRSYLWNIEELDYYYKQNMFVYVKKDKQKLINRLCSIKQYSMLDVVHPVVYLKYKANLELMTLLMNDVSGGYIQKYFSKWEIKTLAIYGTGRIGQYFYSICKNLEVGIPFCIDERADYTIDNLLTRSYESIVDGEVDCIVLASGYHYHEMKKNVEHLKKIKIVSLWELLKTSQRQEVKLQINGI